MEGDFVFPIHLPPPSRVLGKLTTIRAQPLWERGRSQKHHFPMARVRKGAGGYSGQSSREPPTLALRCLWWGGPGMAHMPLLSAQHGTLGSGRSSDKGPSWSTRSLGARCRNSIASCPEEQPHVGNYRLLRTIGKGNFAKVKLARHILTGREVSACDRGPGVDGRPGEFKRCEVRTGPGWPSNPGEFPHLLRI